MKQLIHTPAGVRDIFGDEYERKSLLMDKVHELFGAYGYQYIQTPSIEYYPVFDKDKGTMHASRLFRMIDAEGHTLVLRPDFTPSIARAVSMYFPSEEQPIRLCYQGNVFMNHTNYRGRLNESTEMGVELINYDTPEADAELIALSVAIMKAAGLKDFQISIGNVAYFDALVQEAGLDEDTVSEIRHLLSIRNQFGALELIEKQETAPDIKAALQELPQLFGGIEVLQKARAMTRNAKALSSVDRLQAVYDILQVYGCADSVSFDFGMLSDYTYYTGILFQAVTYGSGDAVIKGGRYNRFIEKFGKEADAIGFTTLVDSILLALARQGLSAELPNDKVLILYAKGREKEAAAEAMRRRGQGERVAVMPLTGISLQAYLDRAKANHCCELFFIKEDGTEENIRV